MTLLTTLFAALICTVIWYKSMPENEMRIGMLCLIYWGAFLMWLTDAVFEYKELHAAYFTPGPADMLNDLYLGLSAVALGLMIWLAALLIKDPKGIIKSMLIKKNGAE